MQLSRYFLAVNFKKNKSKIAVKGRLKVDYNFDKRGINYIKISFYIM